MDRIIRVSNLSYEINSNSILNDVTFDVIKGEFISIIGPNGAGKTTLIKCLSNNLGYNGEIQLKHKNIKQYTLKEKARVIGVVPQEYTLPFNFKVSDVVRMGRNPYYDKFMKQSENDSEMIYMAMHDTHTYQYKDRYYNSLSGGEKQRVLTARALAQNPEVLLLDEITSNLDIHNQLEILELIHDKNRINGVTVISIMHDLNLASRFSDRILLLINGKLEIVDTPKQVIQEDILSKAYHMEMLIRENRVLRFNEVMPLRITRETTQKKEKIHIISGGGTGEYLIEKLYSMRYQLSCGILYEGDSDLDVCRSLKIDYVSEKPFSSFESKTIHENDHKIKDAHCIILTDVPIGRYNLENIRSISEINDKKIIILHAINRDYTNGEADQMIEDMLKKDNVFKAMNLQELFSMLDNI